MGKAKSVKYGLEESRPSNYVARDFYHYLYPRMFSNFCHVLKFFIIILIP